MTERTILQIDVRCLDGHLVPGRSVLRLTKDFLVEDVEALDEPHKFAVTVSDVTQL